MKTQVEDLFLKCGRENNFRAWTERQTDILGPRYGLLATSLLESHVPYVVPATVEADYMPPEVEGEVPLSNANLALLRVDAEKSRGRRVRANAEQLSKLFADFWASVSQDSREIAKAHIDWAEVSVTKDANILYRILRETHFTHVQGGGVAMRALEKQKKVKAFSHLEQGALSLPTFKKEYTDQQDDLVGLGVPMDPDDVQAVKFLDSLDMSRYGEMMKDVRNGAARGIELPQTLQAAYDMAAMWTTEVKTTNVGGAMQSVFVLSDDVVDSTPEPPANPKAWAGKQAMEKKIAYLERKLAEAEKKTPAKEPERCWWCHSVGHHRRDCKEYSVAEKRRDSCRKQEEAVKPDGHVMVAVGLDDEEDDDAFLYNQGEAFC
jgi:hypothetical protein